MFAQSLVDYISLSSMGDAIMSLVYFVRDQLSQVRQSTWVILGLVVLVLLMTLNRRPRRF